MPDEDFEAMLSTKNIVDLKTGKKFLRPIDLFYNATAEGQDKVVIVSMKETGEVGVWSSDMTPAELLYMAQAADYLAGSAAMEAMNTKAFPESFYEN